MFKCCPAVQHDALSTVRILVQSGRVLVEVKRTCSGLWYIRQKGCGFDRAVGPHVLNNCSKTGVCSSEWRQPTDVQIHTNIHTESINHITNYILTNSKALSWFSVFLLVVLVLQLI